MSESVVRRLAAAPTRDSFATHAFEARAEDDATGPRSDALSSLGMDLESVRHVLHAVATTLVPEAAALDAHAWAEVDAVIAGAVSSRPARIQRQFTVFLRLLQTIPVARYGRPFTALSERQRTTFLTAVERSGVLLVRRGFWGLRTLVFMGYYTRDDVAESIGYRADPRGWTARGSTVATVPLAPTLWVEP